MRNSPNVNHTERNVSFCYQPLAAPGLYRHEGFCYQPLVEEGKEDGNRGPHARARRAWCAELRVQSRGSRTTARGTTPSATDR